jgi:N-acetylglucosamine-6-phosphate deacetylase
MTGAILAIVGGTVYTPGRIIDHGVVLVQDGRILDVGPADSVPAPAGATRMDAKGGIVCPGLVDLHIHGGDGADCTDGTDEAVRATARRHLRAGTTAFLATTASAPLPRIWDAFDAIGRVMASPGPDEARVLGIHMEGPYFSLAQRGAHAAELLRMPDEDEVQRLCAYADDGLLTRLTLAPEREGAMDIIARLYERGVLVSGGHSDALYAQVCAAMGAGMRHITHLWSGMSMVRRIGPKRYAGMVEAALVEDDLTAEIIADGYHLPGSLMKMAYRLKGPEKLCIVSDAMRASGLGAGEYEVAGIRAVVEEGGGVAMTPDRTAFAGSISTMLQCMRHMVQDVGVSLRDAITMSTRTPARILGMDDRVGEIARGRHADLLILDPATLSPRQILLGGEAVEAEG